LNPFYFGRSERPLFGVYHPPRKGAGGQGVRGRAFQHGVVLCYPFGVEYMRAHRAFRQLTTLLTRAGVHVLRFDWYGTGDSAGDGRDATVEQWRADLGMAIEELQDTTGIERVSLVGLRLGATLALDGAKGHDDVERVVLWDPVVSGAGYLEEILAREGFGGFPAGHDVVGVQGFPLTHRLFQEIGALEASADGLPEGVRIEMVMSRPDPAYTRLRHRLVVAGVLDHFELLPSEGDWAVGDAFGSALLPQGIIQRIVELVEGAAVR
jgi:uncharacterized protein